MEVVFASKNRPWGEKEMLQSWGIGAVPWLTRRPKQCQWGVGGHERQQPAVGHLVSKGKACRWSRVQQRGPSLKPERQRTAASPVL